MSNIYRDTDGTPPAYAWPGGYPIFYLTEDCGVLCPDCANTDGSTDTEDPQWKIVAQEIHWEGESLICDNCNAEVESAYGPIEDTDDV